MQEINFHLRFQSPSLLLPPNNVRNIHRVAFLHLGHLTRQIRHNDALVFPGQIDARPATSAQPALAAHAHHLLTGRVRAGRGVAWLRARVAARRPLLRAALRAGGGAGAAVAGLDAGVATAGEGEAAREAAREVGLVAGNRGALLVAAEAPAFAEDGAGGAWPCRIGGDEINFNEKKLGET